MSRFIKPHQAETLERLKRIGPTPIEDVDGRVLRALENRGFVLKRRGTVEITEAGAAVLEPQPQTARRRGRRPTAQKAAAHGRAEAIRSAVARLQHAIPQGAEVAVGCIYAAADDVLQGFRKHARAIEKRTGSGGVP